MRLALSIRLLVVALAMLAMASVLPTPASGQVSIGISVGFPPPELPVYEQPICPGEGYIWTPGYWAWNPEDEDYYWVPGTWVLAPQVGYLWTPGYWGWGGTAFVFHEGYWGPTIGYYGGINYGYGYFGRGYDGGRWDRGHFYYNRTVNNVNVTEIHNTYNTTVVNNNVNVTRVSYNGNGGVNARPTAREQAVARERHIGPVAAQAQHMQEARSNRELRASENHGKPPIAATQRPGAFSGAHVIQAKEGGRYNPPPNRGATNRAASNADRPMKPNRSENSTNHAAINANRPNYAHPNDLPKANRSDRPPNTGNSKADQKYQQQPAKMYQQQEQERQKLQQRQDQEHQRMAQQRTDAARTQQMEQRHQQQTLQMQQTHEQQQQRMEQRQQAPSHPNENEKKPRNERP